MSEAKQRLKIIDRYQHTSQYFSKIKNRMLPLRTAILESIALTLIDGGHAIKKAVFTLLKKKAALLKRKSKPGTVKKIVSYAREIRKQAPLQGLQNILNLF